MRFALMVFVLAWVWVPGAAVAAEKPLVVEVWPGMPPEEPGNIGAEMVRMSPKLDHKQVEVTEQTRLMTNVTKPTLTIYRPREGQGHRDRRADLPRGRVLGPLLATGRRGSGRVAELDRRYRHHSQVPRAATAG